MIDKLSEKGQASASLSQHNAGEVAEDIPITPEMIEAGQGALVKWESSDDPYSANCVTAIYRAMAAATETRGQ